MAFGHKKSGNEPTLTTRQGHPVYDNQNQRTVGARGPATLENYHFIEKISHFDRERIPERVVHARGATAFGYFEATGKWGDSDIAEFTRAKLFQKKGAKTDIALRFSTVIGGRDSSEAARDPRGFAVKFYTEDGNWDLVGNNLAQFFIRDAMKFPDVVHSLKPDPVTFRQEGSRIFDFMSQTPEAMNLLVNLFSPRGIPADFRHEQGFGVNTYKWVNAAGETKLVKYHWIPKQGVKSLCQTDADNIQATDLGHATKDLYDSIAAGDFPEWELRVQMMDDNEHPELDFDPLDDTKVWPENMFEPKAIGKIVLNRTPENYFLENDQIAFGTGVLVDGLDFSDDKMLIGRTFSYSDTQRYRLGANYLQLGVNQPKNARVGTNQRDGAMAFAVDAIGENPHVNYEPSITGGLMEAEYPDHEEQGPMINARLTRQRLPRTNDYKQPGERYTLMEQWEKDELVANLVEKIGGAIKLVQERMVWHFLMCDDELGTRVGEGLKIKPADVQNLEPLPTQTLNEDEVKRMQNLGNNGPRDVTGLVMTQCVQNERMVVNR